MQSSLRHLLAVCSVDIQSPCLFILLNKLRYLVPTCVCTHCTATRRQYCKLFPTTPRELRSHWLNSDITVKLTFGLAVGCVRSFWQRIQRPISTEMELECYILMSSRESAKWHKELRRHIDRLASQRLEYWVLKASNLPLEQYSVELSTTTSIICLWFLIFVTEAKWLPQMQTIKAFL